MKTNITHASWMNPIDNGEWDGWNPAWMKAIMDHLDVETEEHVAGVFSTNEDPELVVDLLKHYGDNWAERQTVPYQDLRIGSLYFGSVSIQGIERPAVFWGNGDSEGSMYVATDHVRPLPITPRDPETGLHPNHPGQGFDPYVPPAKPASIRKIDKQQVPKVIEACLDLITAANDLLRAAYANGQGEPQLMKDIFGEEVCTAVAELETLLHADGYDTQPPTPANPAEDTYPVCDQCGVACPPTAHFGTPYGHYCAACYRDQTGDHPEPDEQPVGNVQPKDLYTPLFDEPDAP